MTKCMYSHSNNLRRSQPPLTIPPSMHLTASSLNNKMSTPMIMSPTMMMKNMMMTTTTMMMGTHLTQTREANQVQTPLMPPVTPSTRMLRVAPQIRE